MLEKLSAVSKMNVFLYPELVFQGTESVSKEVEPLKHCLRLSRKQQCQDFFFSRTTSRSHVVGKGISADEISFPSFSLFYVALFQ